MFDPIRDLLESIDRIGSATWSGRAFRHTSAGREPLAVGTSYVLGGRWNPPEIVPTLYLAFPVEACVAEFLRAAQGQAHGTESFQAREIHEVEVRDLRVLDLTSQEALEEVGLTEEDIRSNERGPCQEVGAAALYLGLQGVVAPSATGIGFVLAVFEPSVDRGQLLHVETRPFPIELLS